MWGNMYRFFAASASVMLASLCTAAHATPIYLGCTTRSHDASSEYPIPDITSYNIIMADDNVVKWWNQQSLLWEDNWCDAATCKVSDKEIGYTRISQGVTTTLRISRMTGQLERSMTGGGLLIDESGACKPVRNPSVGLKPKF